MSKVYSGRAECIEDVLCIHKGILENSTMGLIGCTMEVGYFGPDHCSGEIMVEFRFDKEVDRDTLNSIIKNVDDSHVFYQTLEPIIMSENKFIRDYDRQ